VPPRLASGVGQSIAILDVDIPASWLFCCWCSSARGVGQCAAIDGSI